MTLRLYSVSTTVTAVVLAVSESEAEKSFKYQLGDIISDHGVDAQVDVEITSPDKLPENWGMECLPYGPNGNTFNIGECLALVPPSVPRDTKTIDMFTGETTVQI